MIKTVVCAMSCVKQKASGNLPYNAGSSAGCFVVTSIDEIEGQGWADLPVQDVRDMCICICICIPDSLHCTAETNTTL